jgi:hypothetical protein
VGTTVTGTAGIVPKSVQATAAALPNVIEISERSSAVAVARDMKAVATSVSSNVFRARRGKVPSSSGPLCLTR